MTDEQAPSLSDETVCVIGGGIIGLFTALTLQERGRRVILVERDEVGGRQAASFGNGCWINSGAIMPISVPGLWRSVPGFLLDANSPFSIRWRHLPKLAGWLLRFLWAGRNWAQVESQIAKRLPLLRTPLQDYLQRAQEAGVVDLILTGGVMYVYRSQQELDGDMHSWQLRKRAGISVTYLNSGQLRQAEPDLSPEYQYGVLMKDAATLADPGAFCAALAQLLLRRGGSIVTGEVEQFVMAGDRLRAVHAGQNAIVCDKAVIAAGAWSGRLASKLGDSVPLISERGYHITIKAPGVDIRHGLMPAEGKMAVVRTTTGVRLAGQVELASLEAAPRWQRAQIQLDHARRLFPQLQCDGKHHDVWMGHRPSTPDSLPVICRSSRSADIVYAFGHGHTGISMAPATGVLVADLFDRQPAAEALANFYSVKRF